MLKWPGAVLATIGLAALAAAFPRAQQQAPPAKPEPPQQARSVFRAGVEYVAVDVVVTDQHDQLVTDLTSKDFEIVEGDRPQAIVDFTHVAVPASHRAVDLHAVPAPAPDVASNPIPSPSSRVFVFVIDDGAMRAEDVVKLKRAMTSFLENLTPTDRAAVVYTRRSDLGQDFTSDLGQLVRAVNNVNTAVGWNPDAWATRRGLDHVISSLAGLPETRRSVVYVSSGFTMCPGPTVPEKFCDGLDAYPDPRAFTHLGLQDIFDRAKVADVSVYTLDPQGLEAPALNLGGHLEDQTPQNRQLADRKNQSLQNFLRAIPHETQGLAMVNMNDLPSAASAIMADNGDYYVLGYSPSPYVADDKFHPIEVRVVSRPGLHVRARQGYVAAAHTAAADGRGQLLAAVGDAEVHSGLTLHAFAAPVAAAGGGATAVTTLDVSYPAVTGDQPRADDDLLVTYVAADSDGHVLKAEPRTFHVALSGTPRGAVDLAFDDTMSLPKGHWMIIVGASSRLLGTVGTLHLPIEIRDLSGGELEVSPLIIGRSDSPGGLVAQPETIAKLIPFQPTTDRSFSSGDHLRVFSRVVAPKLADVKVELRVLRGKSTVQAVALRTTPSTNSTAEDCETTLDLKGLAPGDYILELSAQPAHGQPTTRAIGFQVH